MIPGRGRFTAVDVAVLSAAAAMGILVAYRITGIRYTWNWRIIPQYLLRRDEQSGRVVVNYLLEGALTTVRLSLWSMLLATALGTTGGLFRTSRRLLLRMLGRTYVELVRNLPPLVLVFVFYYFASDQIMPLLGVDDLVRFMSGRSLAVVEFLFAPKSLVTQFLSGVLTVGIFEGAYITEIVRSGIESVERGQREAAHALGLPWTDEMRFVVMPQAMRRMLPPMAGQFISTIKDSAIVSAISIQELTYQGRQLATSTGAVFEVWISVAALYLTLTLTLALLTGRLEDRLRRGL